MSRQGKDQSAHDRRVRTLANELIDKGWKVQADLSNFDQPDPIGNDGRIPDILATQGIEPKLLRLKLPVLLILIKSSILRSDVVPLSERMGI